MGYFCTQSQNNENLYFAPREVWMNHSIALETRNISKSFPNVKALDDVCFNLYRGEIHALVGENGAGKSTLMKIIYGEHEPDSGSIVIEKDCYATLSPKLAIQNNIGMVHQEFMLIKELSVLENIILGFEPKKSLNRIDVDEAKVRINKYIQNYDMNIHLDMKVSDISVGEAQRVEIIKTLYRGAEILILDEPTAVLTPQESLKLFEILRSMARSGKSIVFISHKLKEVMSVSDRITVMRGGKKIATVETNKTTIPELANMMVGREVFLNIDHVETPKGEIVLSVKDLFVYSEREMSRIKGVSLEVRKGEVLGLAGVDGNGQIELVEALVGIRKVSGGHATVFGRSVQNVSPRTARKNGISHIPADRNKAGLNQAFTIQENLIVNQIDSREFSIFGLLKKKNIYNYALKLIDKYDIRPKKNPNLKVMALSGGNAQKVVIAREVEMPADLLIASHPTRGVDVGSIEFIRQIINKLKLQGKAVLLVSADLEELISLSDRIAVMYEGRITGTLNVNDATEYKMGILMTGGEIA